ncbi:hypothetical protein GC197_15790 [bacterium]|nr:hypothetical protein [bacterium]
MPHPFDFDILPQPDDTTCGPTCLHAVYQYFGLSLDLHQLISEVPTLEQGGTLGVMLGIDALKRGYQATIYTYNLEVFDPVWFASKYDLVDRLQAQMRVKPNSKLNLASQAYIEFLELGGKITMRDLNAMLISRFLHRSIPILTGLSSTYLYGGPREYGLKNIPDDVQGLPQGHFVVLYGMNENQDRVYVADPYLPNPLGEMHHYPVSFDRLVCSILLGILTYDSNLLVIEPKGGGESNGGGRGS